MPYFKTSRSCRRPTLEFLILIVRIILIIAATINLCALSAAYQIYSPKTDTYNNVYNFHDTPQFAFNTFLFLAVLYSFLGSSRWSRRIRITAGLALLGCNASLLGAQFDSIGEAGGCDKGLMFGEPTPTANNQGGSSTGKTLMSLKLRCYIQIIVGVIGILWSVLLAMELVLTDVHRKKEMDQKFNSSYRECEEQQQDLSATTPSIVHLYQPNISLHDSTGADRRTRTGDSLELETLPAYEQRPSGPRAQIIDLANARHLPRPARGTSMGPLRASIPQMIQTPPPSYQAAHL